MTLNYDLKLFFNVTLIFDLKIYCLLSFFKGSMYNYNVYD